MKIALWVKLLSLALSFNTMAAPKIESVMTERLNVFLQSFKTPEQVLNYIGKKFPIEAQDLLRDQIKNNKWQTIPKFTYKNGSLTIGDDTSGKSIIKINNYFKGEFEINRTKLRLGEHAPGLDRLLFLTKILKDRGGNQKKVSSLEGVIFNLAIPQANAGNAIMDAIRSWASSSSSIDEVMAYYISVDAASDLMGLCNERAMTLTKADQKLSACKTSIGEGEFNTMVDMAKLIHELEDKTKSDKEDKSFAMFSIDCSKQSPDISFSRNGATSLIQYDADVGYIGSPVTLPREINSRVQTCCSAQYCSDFVNNHLGDGSKRKTKYEEATKGSGDIDWSKGSGTK